MESIVGWSGTMNTWNQLLGGLGQWHGIDKIHLFMNNFCIPQIYKEIDLL